LRLDLLMGRQDLFELAVGAAVGSDQADRARGEPRRWPHRIDPVAERLLEMSGERRHRALRRRLTALVALGDRNFVEIGGTLRHRLKRLAVIAERRAYPEGVDRIGQDQDLDAAPGEALELRAGEDRLPVVAERVVDRGLVGTERGDVVREAPPRIAA